MSPLFDNSSLRTGTAAKACVVRTRTIAVTKPNTPNYSFTNLANLGYILTPTLKLEWKNASRAAHEQADGNRETNAAEHERCERKAITARAFERRTYGANASER